MKPIGLTTAFLLSAILLFLTPAYTRAYIFFMFLFALSVFITAYEIGEQI
jgi:hypothetical protein